MKKINILFLLFICCILGQAQISFLRTDMPAAGWVNAEQKDTATGFGVNFGQPGANQVYDFSSFTAGSLDTVFYSAPTGAQLAAVPNATISATSDHKTFLLGQDSATFFDWDGLQTEAFGVTLISDYSQIDTQYKFPAVYGQTFGGTYAGSTKILATTVNPLAGALGWDSVKVNVVTSYTDTIDGWGTVKTPVGAYDCLRQHRVEIATVTYYYNTSAGGAYSLVPSNYIPNPTVDTTNTYYYLTKEAHGTVISFTYDSIHQPLTATWSTARPLGVREISVGDYRIYPNPATDVVHVDLTQTDLTAMAMTEISVYDVLGAKLKTQAITSATISVSDLSNGLYLIVAEDKAFNKKVLGKFEVAR